MYGYRIESGKAVIDENEACILNTMFHNYLNGMSLTERQKQQACIIVTARSRKCCKEKFIWAINIIRQLSIKRYLRWCRQRSKNALLHIVSEAKKDVSNRVSFMISAWIFLQNNLKIQQNRQNTYTV